jgi:hypothetical protein
MFVRHALSYGDAWSRLKQEHPKELVDIEHAVAKLTLQNLFRAKILVPNEIEGALGAQQKFDGCWHEAMRDLCWELPPRKVIPPTSSGRHLSIRLLGHVRNKVSIAPIRHQDLLNRWLYTIAPMATRVGAIEIPVALLLLEDAQTALSLRVSPIHANIFQLIRDQLSALSPLSHNSPFLILAASAQAGGVSVIELEREDDVSFRQIVVNRSIEFPAQYHQAGLGVLTYFGSILREKYPNHDAKVRIEQDGLKVRLIIESDNGDREVIEKALQEYELVVRGETAPELFMPSSASTIELKNELRIAMLRVESQRDIINLQGEHITSLKQLFGHSLTQPPAPVAINFQPTIMVASSASQCVDVNTSIPDLAEDVRELLRLGLDESVRTRLLDLTDALDIASGKTTPMEVKNTSGINKLRVFLQDATTAGTKANEALKKVEDGVALIQNLGRKYNAVAEWCGAPQIPRSLLGTD